MPRYTVLGLTETEVLRFSTLNVLNATTFPVFLLLAVILTLPGSVGFSLPVVRPIVAIFLLLE